MAASTSSTRTDRFVFNDITELHPINHTQASDCKNTPLTSLEEVAQNIAEFYERVIHDVKIAKNNCKKDGLLSIDESAAIYLYTMNTKFYSHLNQVLRAEDPRALVPWLPFLKLFINAVKKLPSLSATVWRGVVGTIGSDFLEGTVQTWWSFTSCSSKMSVMQYFSAEKGTLFCIDTISGKDITPYSAFSDETEIILMPGTSFRVGSVSLDINGFTVVHLNEYLANPIDDTDLLSKKEIQSLHSFVFVWLCSRSSRNDEIKTVMDRLQKNDVEISLIYDYGNFQKWIKSYQSQKQIIVITSNNFRKKILPEFHDSPLIDAIYLYSVNRIISNRWTHKYSKVFVVNFDTKEIIKRIANNLMDVAITDKPMSSASVVKRSKDDENACEIERTLRKRPKTEQASRTNFQFVLIDLSTRLGKRASAMLDCLCSLMKDSIIIKKRASHFDLKRLPKKTTLLFVSSEFADEMNGQLEHEETMFILEKDKSKVDYRTRFDNDEDFIFQLADELYRCCKEESLELMKSCQSSLSIEKSKLANQIHVELKKAFRSVSTDNN